MFCRKCGAKIPDDSHFCVKCGAGVIAPNATSASSTGTALAVAPALEPSLLAKTPDDSTMPPSSEKSAAANSVGTPSTVDPLKGIRGWLLLFCLGIVFVQPLVLIVASDTAFEAVFNLLLGAFSLYAGICLWRVRPNALRLVKVYFVLVLSIATLAILASVVTTHSAPSSETPQTNVLTDGARMLIGVAIWWSYFKKSKRVKATYGANL